MSASRVNTVDETIIVRVEQPLHVEILEILIFQNFFFFLVTREEKLRGFSQFKL